MIVKHNQILIKSIISRRKKYELWAIESRVTFILSQISTSDMKLCQKPHSLWLFLLEHIEG